jgi:hypothetical protein
MELFVVSKNHTTRTMAPTTALIAIKVMISIEVTVSATPVMMKEHGS